MAKPKLIKQKPKPPTAATKAGQTKAKPVVPVYVDEDTKELHNLGLWGRF